MSINQGTDGDFLGGPVVESPHSSAGDSGLVPGRDLRSHMPKDS